MLHIHILLTTLCNHPSYQFNVYYINDTINDMGASYNEKCDKCGIERPEFFVQVNKTISDSSKAQFWCLECIRGKSFEGSE